MHGWILPFLGLFYTGNRCPLDRWNHPIGSLQSILDSKDFRGVFAITEVKVERSGLTRRRVTYSGGRAVGYTPIRTGFYTFRSRGEDGRAKYDLPVFDPAFNVVTIRCRWHFRIGPVLNRISRWTTGRWAPYVVYEVVYQFGVSQAEAHLVGSAIPSQTYYWDGQYCDCHDMNANPVADIDNFLVAGSKPGLWNETAAGGIAPLRPGNKVCR